MAARAAAADLVNRRLLLAIDCERTVREALAVYDRLVAQDETVPQG
jgi:hypothetical protein